MLTWDNQFSTIGGFFMGEASLRARGGFVEDTVSAPDVERPLSRADPYDSVSRDDWVSRWRMTNLGPIDARRLTMGH